MSDNTKNRKNEIEDNLNKDHIEQYHKAVLSFSNQSFEIKKMCVTVEIGAFTLVSSLFKDNYTDTTFISLIKVLSLLIPVLFYIVDIYTYFYQDKLRKLMYSEESLICKRHNIDKKPNKRFTKSKYSTLKRLFRSIFAFSNFIYWGLLLLSIIIPNVL